MKGIRWLRQSLQQAKRLNRQGSLRFGATSAIAIGLLLAIAPLQQVESTAPTLHWMKVKAHNKEERSLVSNTGVSIEVMKDDYVIAIGNQEEKEKLAKLNLIESSYAMVGELDFPPEDSDFHNYAEVTAELTKMHLNFPDITELTSIGKSLEGRDILSVRISTNLDQSKNKPAILFMGGHHSREHLSVEVPLRFAWHLLNEYYAGNQRIVNLIQSREIHIIPAVNPDGLEFDVSAGSYKYWRKNRRHNKDGTYGVDLNRNYGFKWGTGGSSSSPSSDTYMGPNPFSEPETQAIKKYVEDHVNISILLSFHTYSQLILYPWGHSYDPIPEHKDQQVHEIMAKKMAEWNQYTPEQSSDLYIASGDTTDWAYGEHKIISFTFELDPSGGGFGSGGFYPGEKVIPEVLRKNIEPCLYLMDLADNPYRVLGPDPLTPTLGSRTNSVFNY